MQRNTTIAVLLILLATTIGFVNPTKVNAAFPKYVNFQGKLTTVSGGTNVANGTYAFEFKIYNVSSGGTALWTESWDGSPAECPLLTVTNGVFNAKLGSCSPLTIDVTGGELYLSVNFNPGGGLDGEMTPRKQLVASAFSFNANNVVGDGRIDIAYAPADAVSHGAKISYAPSVSSGNNTLHVITGTNVTGAAIELAGAGSTSRTINSTSAALILQTTTSGNINLNSAGGTIELQDNTNITGALTVSGAITNATSYNGLVITANTGVITTGTWNGTDIAVLDGGTGASTSQAAINNLSQLTTNGDLLYHNGTNSTRLARGSDTQCLTSNTTTIVWGSCGAGGSTSWHTIGDATLDGSIALGTTEQTMDWDFTTTAHDGLTYNFDNNGGTAGTDSGLVINNAVSTNSSGDLNTENLLLIQQLDTTTSGTTVVDNALKIDVAGSSGVTDGLEITNSAGNIINGLNFVDTGGGTFATAIAFSGTFTNIFDVAGTGISAVELSLLDGKTGSLVDTDDFTSSDGSGATSSGSGLEAGTGGIGLLQGCGSGQTLKWDEASSIWQCGSDRATYSHVLTGDYTNTTITFSDVDDNATGTSDMGFPVGANEQWVFIMNVQHNSPAAADSQWQITAPASSTCDFTAWVHGVSTSNIACGASSGNIATAGAADASRMSGSVSTSGTAGSVQLQFRQNAVSGTSTIYAGSFVLAWRVDGADLAEIYYSRDKLDPGTVVVLDPTLSNGIKPSSQAYDEVLVGVVSTKPGLVIGNGENAGNGAAPVPLALSGRVPVRVNTENGPIQQGDYLTSSSTSGVAMKATKAGVVIGIAMEDYDGGTEGLIQMFVKNMTTMGTSITPLINDSDNEDDAQQILSAFLSQNQELADNNAYAVTLSSVNTDRLAAGLEVVTPRVVADGLVINSLASLTTKPVEVLSDIIFFGRPYLTGDTAGFAVIEQGQREVRIDFDNPYLDQPVVITTLTLETTNDQRGSPHDFDHLFDSVTRYLVVNKDVNGFTIILEKQAPEDLRFSWTAWAVNNPKTFFSLKGITNSKAPEFSEAIQQDGELSTVDPTLEPNSNLAPQEEIVVSEQESLDDESLVSTTPPEAISEAEAIP